MKLSDYVVDFIKKQGVDTIFGYQGGTITHLVDSIFKSDEINFVSLYHEQSASFAAEGYSRSSGNIGVAIATSGPGATNLITGIGSCFYDSIACVFITGQVNTYESRRNNKIRQEGFQETDIVKIVSSITKYSIKIDNINDIRYHLEKSFFLAKNGRPGPVLLDIPMDIQRSDINVRNLRSFYDTDEYLNLKNAYMDIANLDKTIDSVISNIKSSDRPVILVGGGVRLSKATDELKKFTNLTHIPVVTTLMGLDALPHDIYSHVGYMGAYGSRYSNLAVANSDLLIVLGSRLTSRQTSPNTESFARGAKIIHVDIDKNELNLKFNEDISILCDIKLFLTELNCKIKLDAYKYDFSNWMSKINNYKSQYPSYPTQKINNNIDPNQILNFISNLYHENTIFCLDVGQNQIWAAQSLNIKKNQRVLNSGGMGSMGFSIPCAIGAWYSNKSSQIVSIVGDGGFQMNIQELQTIVRDKIPLKIILMNNMSLGMIRHFQELYFDSKYYGTIDGYSTPDFSNICNAYKIKSSRISSDNDISILEDLIKDNEAALIEIVLNQITYVIPKLEMGNPIEDQSPLVPREDLEKNMIVEIYKKNL